MREAERFNGAAGHENRGFLSWSHGFVPKTPPLTKLDRAFGAWDELAAELPKLYRDMSLRDVPRVLLGSANMSAMILYIVTNAVLFSFLMTSEQIPQAMTKWITSSGLTWIEFLLFVNLLLLAAGNVMEPSSIVLITAPILCPVAVGLEGVAVDGVVLGFGREVAEVHGLA